MLTAEQLAALPKDRRKEVEKTLRQLEDLRRDDPLAFFHACPSNCGVPGCVPHPHQHEFLLAKTKTQAVFAGNRFGKTTALVVKCLIQHYPKDRLPDRLKPYRFVTHDRPVRGRLMCPSEDSLQGYVIPKVQEWVPQHLLLGKSWAKAYSKQHGVLHFADGGLLEFRTYKVDPATLVGADLDYVANDEPSPEPHAKENWWRLIDRNGKMIHALTPVNMTGGGIGWLYRDVYKKRDSEHITVIQGAIHDNAHLDAAEVKLTLESATEKEREAREFGRFVHMGGMVYDGGFEGVLMNRDPYDSEEDRRFIQRLDVVVGMDPGLKNAAFTWVGFDADNRAYVFDEVLLQEKTPTDYANALRRTNAKWGIKDPLYVIDPSARNRSLTNAESVEALLQAQGIYPMHGYNPVEAGIQQIRLRMEKGMFYVSPSCRGLRDEAEEYRMADRPDGEFKVVKENDHRLDSLRYAITTRLWDPQMDSPTEAPLGWNPEKAPSPQQLAGAFAARPQEVSPLGSMS
jgi:hypothetical protein